MILGLVKNLIFMLFIVTDLGHELIGLTFVDSVNTLVPPALTSTTLQM